MAQPGRHAEEILRAAARQWLAQGAVLELRLRRPGAGQRQPGGRVVLQRVALANDQLHAVAVDPFEVQALGAQHVRDAGADRRQGRPLVGGVRRRQPGQPVRLLHRLGLLPLVVARLQPQQAGAHFVTDGADQPLGRCIQLACVAGDGDQAIEAALAGGRLDQRAIPEASARQRPLDEHGLTGIAA